MPGHAERSGSGVEAPGCPRAGWRLAFLLGASLALGACSSKKTESPQEHTVRKLEEELQKHPPQGAVPRAPGSDLAQIATSGNPEAQTIQLHGRPHERLGMLDVSIEAASLRSSVSNGKLSVASETPFVELEVGVSNLGDSSAKIDLGLAKLSRAGNDEPVAEDAQRLAGSRQLALTLEPHSSTTATLLFESPAPGKGTLDLVLPGSPEVRIPVQ